MKQFEIARKRFDEAAKAYAISFPMEYKTWITLPREIKAAALYLNFYQVIQLSVYNTTKNSPHVTDEDVLSVCLQAIVKNVSIIEDHEKRFTSAYMYTVIHNAVISITRTVKNRAYYTNTVSCNLHCTETGSDLDLMDLANMNNEYSENHLYESEFWDDIESMDAITLKYVDFILNGGYFGKKLEANEYKIVNGLKCKLAKYLPSYLQEFDSKFTSFMDVCQDQNIDSVTCIMRDGSKAVYCGEKIVNNSGDVTYIFMGAEKDYYVPFKMTHMIEVIAIDKK